MHLIIAGLGLACAGLAWLFRPLATKSLSASKPEPAPDFEMTMERFRTGIAGKEGPEILEPCRSILLGHGYKTGQAVLFLHGLTSCPRQFEALGKQIHAMGYNVFVPRLPLHGQVDRLNGSFSGLTADALKTFIEECLAISHGLGDKLTVVGLSGGGVLASWLAQFRPDIEQVVIISPSLGLYHSNPLIHRTVTKLMLRLPNIYNLRTAENQAIAPPYVQIKNSSHGAAQFFRLGLAVFEAARKSGPACRKIVVIINAADIVINNGLVKHLTRLWQARSGGQVKMYEFEASLRLPHDLIDPNAKVNNTAIVYPVLLELITKGTGT
ncbi:MAG: hypothetical protein JWP00_3058 [Chloroflexi bacterium]|nr:hypothetical protein [Chloroflexota bacterium]